jgi:four helix bundle protein
VLAFGIGHAPARCVTPQELKDRTKRFAVNVILFVREFPTTIDSRELGRQLLRAATSVASNYRATCRARSRAEFIAKLGTVLEESDESLFWLELVVESKMKPLTRVEALIKEADQLTAIFAASLKTAKRQP